MFEIIYLSADAHIPILIGLLLIYDTVSDVVECKVQFAGKILTPNRMD